MDVHLRDNPVRPVVQKNSGQCSSHHDQCKKYQFVRLISRNNIDKVLPGNTAGKPQ